MAKDSDPLADALETENTGGLFSGLLAEENELDRKMLWRLGSWGAGAVGAVIVAVMANQAQLGWRRDQTATADLVRQAQQLQALTRESQNEARRLASAIDTLNTDRDRLYARVTVLEQGLDSVTGTIAKQAPALGQPAAPSQPAAQALPKAQPIGPEAPSPVPAPQASAPAVAPVAAAPVSSGDKTRAEASSSDAGPLPVAPPAASVLPLTASKSPPTPPDTAAAKPVQPDQPTKPTTEAGMPAEPSVAVATKEAEPEAAADLPTIPVQRTEFAVELGGANSIGGLRALWRSLMKGHPELATLRPIIMIRESTVGSGMQLRLAAGPLADAAAAARICAQLAETQRGCETTVFDGQRLAMKTEAVSPAGLKPGPPQRRHATAQRAKNEKPEEPPAPKPEPPPATSGLSSFFGRR